MSFRYKKNFLCLVGFATWGIACAPRARPVMSAEEHNRIVAASSAAQEVDVANEPAVGSVDGPGAAPSTEVASELATDPPAQPSPVAGPEVSLPRGLPLLTPFYARLEAILRGESEDSVRILWLGDSHTAADFLTEPVRNRLAEEIADGGPGFVRLGLGGYRHGKVTFRVQGRFRKAPILPAQRTRVLDGVFGYGGIRTLPASGGRATASLRDPSEGRVRWTLSYRLHPQDRLEVRLGDSKVVLASDEHDQLLQAHGVAERTFEGEANEEFSVAHVGGDPEIFGAYVERVEPGVVLDTVGINGARVATPLAWEPEQFRAVVKNRKIDLLVLAFGTNEVFDKTRVSHYRDQTKELVELLRRDSPELPCWIIGPPDAATGTGKSRSRVPEVTRAQREAAQELGCAFTSQFELMGGEGSFARWMQERPSLARSDHIHFTIAGYRELGRLLAESLLPPTPPSDPAPREEPPSDPVERPLPLTEPTAQR